MFRGDRRREFKRGTDGDECRRKREEERLVLRKKNRQEQLQKRRMGNDKNTVLGDAAGGNDNPALTDKLQELPMIVAGVRSNDPRIQYEKVTQIRKMLSSSETLRFNKSLSRA